MFYPISSGSIALSLKIKFKTPQKLSCSQGITQMTTQSMMMEPKTIYVSPIINSHFKKCNEFNFARCNNNESYTISINGILLAQGTLLINGLYYCSFGSAH